MSTTLFSGFEPVAFEGPYSDNPLSYRWYDAERVVLGRTLRDHLRLAVAYRHGPAAMRRMGPPAPDAMQAARDAADAAFDLFRILGVPFYTFRDRDIAPEGCDLLGSLRNFHTVAAHLASKMHESGTRLLWGAADLCGHPRYRAGAATSPDPDVFVYAATVAKHCLDATHALGGQNYLVQVALHGRGTPLNTRPGQEADQLGRFLALVVEYKHKVGFPGQILVEPRPPGPAACRHGCDAAAMHGFLRRHGLDGEVRLDLDPGQALLAGPGILGSLEVACGDPSPGWSAGRAQAGPHDATMAFHHLIQAGGLGLGGCSLDWEPCPQSIDAADLVHAHVGGIDRCARAVLAAARVIEDGRYAALLDARYAGWAEPDAQAMLAGAHALEAIAAATEARNPDPQPRSGRQEQIENLLERFL